MQENTGQRKRPEREEREKAARSPSPPPPRRAGSSGAGKAAEKMQAVRRAPRAPRRRRPRAGDSATKKGEAKRPLLPRHPLALPHSAHGAMALRVARTHTYCGVCVCCTVVRGGVGRSARGKAASKVGRETWVQESAGGRLKTEIQFSRVFQIR